MVTSFMYPHYLYVRSNPETTQNETGDWISTGGAWSLLCICRGEPSFPAGESESAEGVYHSKSADVYMQRSRLRVAQGTEVKVLKNELTDLTLLDSEDWVKTAAESGQIVTQGVCKDFDNGRLHNRMWL